MIILLFITKNTIIITIIIDDNNTNDINNDYYDRIRCLLSIIYDYLSLLCTSSLSSLHVLSLLLLFLMHGW